jgi:hypothetical protein
MHTAICDDLGIEFPMLRDCEKAVTLLTCGFLEECGSREPQRSLLASSVSES